MSQFPEQQHLSSNSDDNIDTIHDSKHNKKRRPHSRSIKMPSPTATPKCSFCNHLSHLNAEFYDQRLDLLDLSYVFILLFLSSLNLLPFQPLLLPFQPLLLPFSFLIYTYLRRGPLYKPPEPPPDMAIVRLAGNRAYSRDGSYRDFQDWGRSGRGEGGGESRKEYGRACLVCDEHREEQREGMRCEGKEKGVRARMWERVEEIVDLRVPQLGV